MRGLFVRGGYSVIGSLFLVSLLVISCKTLPNESASKPADTGNQTRVSRADDGTAYSQLGAVINNAKDKRFEITDKRLEQVDKELFAHADASLKQAETLFNKGERALSGAEKNAALKDAQLALSGYTSVLNKYWLGMATEARNRALAAQEESLKVRANVAVREDYQHANSVHGQGDASFNKSDFQQAASYFGDAAGLYTAVTAVALEKRRTAALALQTAETKILESEKIAADADSFLTRNVQEEQL